MAASSHGKIVIGATKYISYFVIYLNMQILQEYPFNHLSLIFKSADIARHAEFSMELFIRGMLI